MTKKKELDAATFSPRYVWHEIRKVHWTRWKKHGTEQGLWNYFGDTALFMVFFALFSFVLTWLISVIWRLL